MGEASEVLELIKGHDYSRKAIAALHVWAQKDNVDALNELAAYLDDGVRDASGRVLVRRDRATSKRYTRRAAELGDAGAICSLAGDLTKSPHTRAEGIRLYRKAFRLGASTAGYNLAVTYLNLGRHRLAVRWFRRAHAAGDVSALLQVARAELYGLGTRRNVAAAFAKLERIARAPTRTLPRNWDRVAPMRIMADALSHGWLNRIDYPASQRWLRRAARLGSGIAKAELSGF